jgi:hypothetical protein
MVLIMSIDRIREFKKYIIANGCELLPLTNEWEWARFKIPDRPTSVIYANKRNQLSGFINDGEVVWQSFFYKEPFPKVTHKTKPKNIKDKRLPILLDRDGNRCFYCKRGLSEGSMTIEHLIPRACGGLHHVSNLVIACRPCNQAAGHLSVMEKIKIRDSHNDQAI